MKPLALSSIRKQNLSQVLDLLTLSPACTRQDLAEATGLSQMTVTNLVEMLKKQGVLHLTPSRGMRAGASSKAARLMPLPSQGTRRPG